MTKVTKAAKATVLPTVDDNWRAREDLRTLMEAEAVKADKKRHAAAVAEGKRNLESLKGALSNEKGEKDEEKA